MEIRNFCIIAHIDHGKSTLSDRLLEATATVSKRLMKAQILDQMDIERERGITIKLQPARMEYEHEKTQYILNLIDTPGHVDFTYEVSRSLAAVEGAILLVDATQGIQAQTLANLFLALEQNLTIIPVINKIDLPSARPDEVSREIIHLLGCDMDDIVRVSAKTGEGVHELLSRIVQTVPPPTSREKKNTGTRALIFDSLYDEYRGVVAYVRIIEGAISKHNNIFFKATATKTEALEVGYFKPKMVPSTSLEEGEIGYIVTGLHDVKECGVGDTITLSSTPKVQSLPGYRAAMPMVFAGLFCRDGDQFQYLRDGVEKLKLNDAAFSFEPEHSPALGYGFRCGFLGLLHLEIIQERLKREYNLDLVVTTPSVAYNIILKDNTSVIIHNPLELPDGNNIEHIQEPWTKVDIISPEPYIGNIMSLVAEKKGYYKNTEYLTSATEESVRRVILHFELPLASILVDFYDTLKSVSSGYASLNYEVTGYRNADVVRLDVIVAEDTVDSLATMVYRDQAYFEGKKIVKALKDSLPRQQFEIKLQAAVGGKIVAAERISALRKDVTVGLYGGDVTRKQKLLEKQKKGKKRMKASGKVEIPTDTFLKLLRR
ncbi:MAG: translation elongation factor 4 [bacterium]|nr:translation elongation factor 4 [bacterium]